MNPPHQDSTTSAQQQHREEKFTWHHATFAGSVCVVLMMTMDNVTNHIAETQRFDLLSSVVQRKKRGDEPKGAEKKK